MFSIYEIETTNLICHRDGTRLNDIQFDTTLMTDQHEDTQKTSSQRLLKPLLN